MLREEADQQRGARNHQKHSEENRDPFPNIPLTLQERKPQKIIEARGQCKKDNGTQAGEFRDGFQGLLPGVEHDFLDGPNRPETGLEEPEEGPVPPLVGDRGIIGHRCD